MSLPNLYFDYINIIKYRIKFRCLEMVMQAMELLRKLAQAQALQAQMKKMINEASN
jgi:hypothetical protein